MKIGYPCLNYSLDSKRFKTFRLASYTQKRFLEALDSNLKYLQDIIEFNAQHNFKFFRIHSGTIPFASHPIMKVNWQKEFKREFQVLGQQIHKYQMRISMHPDQFVLINSPRKEVVETSIKDLIWHAEFLDLMGLDETAKIQIHVGGVYADRMSAMRSFIANYVTLPEMVKKRLVIENDDKNFPLNDCLKIHEAVGIPVIFDNFHHECLNQGEWLFEAMMMASGTWDEKDGVMMVDYSSQQPGAIKGRHVDSLNEELFKDFLKSSQGLDFDMMLEIKDKEKSAFKALEIYEGLANRSEKEFYAGVSQRP